MPRRKKSSDFFLIGLVVFGGVVAAIAKFFETVGFVIPLAIVGFAFGLYALNLFLTASSQKRALEANRRAQVQLRKQAEQREKAWRDALMLKYNDQQVVDSLIAKRLWIGQTSEQLQDSFGAPDDVDERVLKTKRKEVWKYGHKGANRYEYRITLENDRVVGWDEKA